MTHRDHDSGGVVRGGVVVRGVTLWFPINNSYRDASISLKLLRRVKHHKKQDKFDNGVILEISTEVCPFFDLDFGLVVNLWFPINNF